MVKKKKCFSIWIKYMNTVYLIMFSSVNTTCIRTQTCIHTHIHAYIQLKKHVKEAGQELLSLFYTRGHWRYKDANKQFVQGLMLNNTNRTQTQDFWFSEVLKALDSWIGFWGWIPPRNWGILSVGLENLH